MASAECQARGHRQGCIHVEDQTLVFSGRSIRWQRGHDSVRFTMTGQGASRRAAAMWAWLRAEEPGGRSLLDLLMEASPMEAPHA